MGHDYRLQRNVRHTFDHSGLGTGNTVDDIHTLDDTREHGITPPLRRRFGVVQIGVVGQIDEEL